MRPQGYPSLGKKRSHANAVLYSSGFCTLILGLEPTLPVCILSGQRCALVVITRGPIETRREAKDLRNPDRIGREDIVLLSTVGIAQHRERWNRRNVRA